MLHIVQFSGGAASAYVAWLVAQEHPDNTILLFHDTKTEHPDAYRFRQQVAEYIGLPIAEVSDGRDIWELIKAEHCLPNYFVPFCTRILKVEQGEKFLSGLDKPYMLYNGFGPDEWQRVQRATVRAEAKGRVVKSPLFTESIRGEEVKRIIRDEWGICLPEPYKHLRHNNCIPCFKGGKWQFYKVWRHYPKAFQKAVEAEKMVGHTVFMDATLTELAEYWEASRNQMELDFGEDDGVPCMCAF